MIKKIFLIGNPNVGKSVVFSRLTGVNVIASNYPGTTVELIKGYLKLAEERIAVVDLPGSIHWSRIPKPRKSPFRC